MNDLFDMIGRIFAAFAPGQLAVCGHPAPTAWEELLWANSGGPSSRVVSTPIVSRVLSKGSKTLGFRPLEHYEMQPRYSSEGFRNMARRLLRKAGFASPEQAWEALRDELPGQAALAVDAPRDSAPDIAREYEHESLIAALVLGKCCGSLFSPARPIIWSERRLARSLKLVHCDSESFTREDDD